MEDAGILNNTFVTSGSFMFIWGPNNTYRDIDIRNNLLIDVGKMIFVRDGTDLDIDGLTIRNNLRVDPEMNTQWWYNFGSATVSNVDTMSTSEMLAPSNPLAWSGDKPAQYYMPASGSSAVVDQGVDVGFAFEGAAPDIGAYEWGGTTTIGADTTLFGDGGMVSVRSGAEMSPMNGGAVAQRGSAPSASAAVFDLRGRVTRGGVAGHAVRVLLSDHHRKAWLQLR
ncbi:MAG: hypothetical protein GF331_16220 [Chitinivibrionales bacterium]|nr:hypothetical protein [Chitinivibrionales bacterium]